jgi:multiple sugar transport system ATP-binding protein
MEVFKHPVNTFVATFIGSPPMNLLPGTDRRAARSVWRRHRGAVPDRLKDQCAEGKRSRFGIRPDDIMPGRSRPEPETDPAPIELPVELAEPLGMESLIYTRAGRAGSAGQDAQPAPVTPGERLAFRMAWTGRICSMPPPASVQVH